MSSTAKHDRIPVRLNAEAKAVLQRAAHYRHNTLSQFVLTTALVEAEKVIRENETIALSAADSKVLCDALINPQEPNTALRKAFAKRKDKICAGR